MRIWSAHLEGPSTFGTSKDADHEFGQSPGGDESPLLFPVSVCIHGGAAQSCGAPCRLSTSCHHRAACGTCCCFPTATSRTRPWPCSWSGTAFHTADSSPAASGWWTLPTTVCALWAVFFFLLLQHFCFLIFPPCSSTANRHMLRALAEAGGGAFEFFDVKTRHNWAEKVSQRTFNKQ